MIMHTYSGKWIMLSIPHIKFSLIFQWLRQCTVATHQFIKPLEISWSGSSWPPGYQKSCS